MKLNNTLLSFFHIIASKMLHHIASRRDIYYFRGDRGGEEMRIFLHEHQLLIFDSIVFKALFVKASISSHSDRLDENFDIF